MDPNAALEELRKLIAEAAASSSETTDEIVDRLDTIAELVHALDEWLSRGGFLPAAWNYARKITVPDGWTFPQYWAAIELCKRWNTPLAIANFAPAGNDLPTGYRVGWVGAPRDGRPGTIYCGIAPDGRVSS
jgi:hypothetical protein